MSSSQAEDPAEQDLVAARLRRVFTALADLAPVRQRSDDDIPSGVAVKYLSAWDPSTLNRKQFDYLASRDALHAHQRILRRALGIVHYRREDGRLSKFAILVQPIRLERVRRGYHIVPAGDVELSPRVGDAAAQLESAMPTDFDADPDQTREWVAQAAAATGFGELPVLDEDDRRAGSDQPERVIAASALFAVRDYLASPSVADGLVTWAGTDDLDKCVLAAVYGTGSGSLGVASGDAAVSSPLPLDPDQREAVVRARSEPVSVISGAPGCGKSHVLAAIAVDAVARGESVLMATQSAHAADVLAELLARQPGPVPVQFGDSEKRDRLLTTLTSGSSRGRSADEVRNGRNEAQLTAKAAAALQTRISAQLELEAAAARAATFDRALLDEAPGLLDPDCDPDQLAALLTAAQQDGGWLDRWRAKRARRRLGKLTRSTLPATELEFLAPVAADLRAAAKLSATEGTCLDDEWDRLWRAENTSRESTGRALRHTVEESQRRDQSALRAMAALGRALRSHRGQRRRALAEIDAAPLLRALPLWIGTVSDVADLLPQEAAMFDVVILDEASHIDQLRSAPVLARAKRAVIAGDPKQLRFVSFVSDEKVSDTVRRHDLSDISALLDVRRNSAFDLAAGTTTVTMLREHYRSVPHLIGFSARRFYDGQVSTATRHPRNDQTDAIEVHRVPGCKANDGIIAAEVDAALNLTASLVEAGTTDIALITPFRAQADRIESALLAKYSADDIIDLRLRTGTVHMFQGSEADTVIASLAVHADDSPSRKRFAADPNLFNVLLTRAKRQLHVVTSLTGPDGLLGDFLDYAEHPPTPPRPGGADGFAEALAAELVNAGADVTLGYPVGRWTVDVCLGNGADAVGLICGIHPDGVAAHLARQRVLHQVGWRLRDVFSSQFGGDPVRAALSVLADERARPM